MHFTHFIDLTWNSHTNPYNLAIVNLDPLNDYTSTHEQEVGVLSLGYWGGIILFIYLFIHIIIIFYKITANLHSIWEKIHAVEPSFNKPL